MDENDYNNLRFLLTVSPEVLADWYAQASNDDIEYAEELLKHATSGIDMIIAERLDEITDVSVAEKALRHLYK